MNRTRVVNRIIVVMMVLCIAATSFLFLSVSIHAENYIPAYDGSAAVVINRNIPGFTAKEITSMSFEYYGELDRLGRCTTAVACIGQELMPTQERQSIGDVRPTGWVQNKYPGIIDSDPPYLYKSALGNPLKPKIPLFFNALFLIFPPNSGRNFKIFIITY